MRTIPFAVAALVLATVHTAAQHSPYFGGPSPIDELNQGGGNNFSPALTEDELYIVFASDRPGSQGYDLYESRRPDVDAKWSPPIRLSQLNSPAHDYEPNISYDGLELYFASTRSGIGPSDLWMSRRSSPTAPWGPPQNLGSQINGPNFTNDNPALVQDGLTMYFTSSGRSASADIFVATRTVVGAPWGNVRPFAPANSTAFDHSPIPEGNGDTVWFASDRAGSASSDWYMTAQDHVTRTWSAPVRIPELSSSSWDSNGYLGGLTSRMYASVFSGPNTTSQLCIWCRYLVRHRIKKCIESRWEWRYCPQCRRYHWTKVWLWGWAWGPWHWHYYNWRRYADATATRFGFVALGTSPVGIALPGFEGHVWLDLSTLIQFGSSPLPTTGLVTTTVPLPADPNLIGLELSFQDVIVNGTLTGGEISEVARVMISP